VEKVNKKTLIILLIVCLLIFVLLPISPYSILQRINAKNIILKDSILSSQFNKKDIVAVEYKGDNTFLINTDEKQFVVIRENTSFMNYKWKVFEYKFDLPE
jgi:hypothetical protein